MVIAEDEEASKMDSTMDVDEDSGNIERSKVAFQLDKMCKLLQLNTPDNAQEVDILHRLARHIQATLQASSDLLSKGPPLILQNIGELNAQQVTKLHAVEDLLFKVLTSCTSIAAVAAALKYAAQHTFLASNNMRTTNAFGIVITGLRTAEADADEAHGGHDRVLPVEREGLQQRRRDQSRRARPTDASHCLSRALHCKNRRLFRFRAVFFFFLFSISVSA